MSISTLKVVLSMAAFAVIAFLSGCATAPKVAPREPVTESHVFYGGFSYAGAAEKIPERYPYFSRAFPSGGTVMASEANTACHEFFSSLDGVANADGSKTVDLNQWTKMKIGTRAQKNDVPLVLSIGLTEEIVLRETFENQYKVHITLWFSLLVLDFDTKEVVSSKPFFVDRVRVKDTPFSDDEIAAMTRELITKTIDSDMRVSRFYDKLRKSSASVYGRGKNILQMQVRTIDTGADMARWLPPELKKSPGLYTELLGQQLTDIFGSTSNVAMLPFAKDGLNASMALVFSDNSMVNFRIPEPSYVIDVKLDGIAKKKGKSDAYRTIWAFTVGGTASISEPLTNNLLHSVSAEVTREKYDSTGKIETDDYPTVSEATRRLFRELSKKANADKKTRANVLDRCRL